MKNILYILFLSCLAFSCEDRIEFNNPALQGQKNNSLWRAEVFSATTTPDGKLQINGVLNNEYLTLFFPILEKKTYTITPDSNTKAQYVIGSTEIFSTSFNPDPEAQLYPPEGQVRITEIDLANNTITGDFYFTAYNTTGLNSVTFNEGVFYKIPLNAEDTNIFTPCEQAIADTEAAKEIFDTTEVIDQNYSEACNNYKTALTAQINLCGDESGELQAIIDTLGDCSRTMANGVISVTIGTTLSRTYEKDISFIKQGTVLKIIAKDDMYDDWIYFELEEMQTGTNAIQNFVIHLNTANYKPLDNFTSEITNNNGTTIQGTFSGTVESEKGSRFNLSNGKIDIRY